MHRVSILVFAGMLVTVAIGGCGGGDESGEAADQPAAVSQAESESLADSPEAGHSARPLDEAIERLRSAGYTVARGPATGTQDAITANGVDVYYYVDTNKARTYAQGIQQIVDANPGRGVSALRGHLVFFYGQERELTGAELGAFDDIVAITAEAK